MVGGVSVIASMVALGNTGTARDCVCPATRSCIFKGTFLKTSRPSSYPTSIHIRLFLYSSHFSTGVDRGNKMTRLGSPSWVLLNCLLGNSGDLFQVALSLKFNEGLRHKAIIDPVLQ